MELDGSLTLSVGPTPTCSRAGLRAAVVSVLGRVVAGASGGTAAAIESRSFITSDGARLHDPETGPSLGQTVVFVPG